MYLFGVAKKHDFVDLNKNSKMDIFEDPNVEAIERAKDIISYLSIEEKIAQLEIAHLPFLNWELQSITG